MAAQFNSAVFDESTPLAVWQHRTVINSYLCAKRLKDPHPQVILKGHGTRENGVLWAHSFECGFEFTLAPEDAPSPIRSNLLRHGAVWLPTGLEVGSNSCDLLLNCRCILITLTLRFLFLKGDAGPQREADNRIWGRPPARARITGPETRPTPSQTGGRSDLPPFPQPDS
jgi:hypothetical protein